MGRTRTTTVTESLSELRALRPKMKGSRQLGRLNFLFLLKKSGDMTMSEMAEHLDVSRNTLDKWSATYRNNGMDVLLKRETRNKPSKLIPERVHQALAKRLKDPKLAFHGYRDAHQWVCEEFGIEISYNWLRDYMRDKFGTKLKIPRTSNAIKDGEAVEVSKKPRIQI